MKQKNHKQTYNIFFFLNNHAKNCYMTVYQYNL